tara:strand:+ start:491 stop:1291 length:801 start_codon:yes stop_codon:yes gene_type:complete
VDNITLSIGQMALVYLFLALPIGLFLYLRLVMIRRLLIAVGRMTIQLVLIGLYLRYLFNWNHPALNILWLVVMMLVASGHVLHSANFKRLPLFSSVFSAIALAMLVVLTPFVAGIIQPAPVYDARYLIPIGGMLLGNFLTANIVALTHYRQALIDQPQSLQSALCFGATPFEACLPMIREAFKRAITPLVTTISTLGLVSLPGMMTGQILGGAFPMTAIQYQIAIMLAIISASALSVFLSLILISRRVITARGAVDEEILNASLAK